MTVLLAPMCLGCKHLRPAVGARTCDAFPDGIPQEILEWQADHRQPVPGDNGIRLDPESADWADYVERVLGPAAPVQLDDFTAMMNRRMAELAYDPHQPRRADGKWGTKGGSAGGGGGGGGVAGPTEAGSWGSKQLRDADQQALEQDPYYYTDRIVGTKERVSSALKAQAMHAIGDDLDKQFPQDRLEAAAKAMNFGQNVTPGDIEGDATTYGHVMADAMLTTWSQAAYDQVRPDSVAMQLAVSKEFGTGLGDFIEKDFQTRGFDPARWPAGSTAAGMKFDQEVMQAGVRSMYDHTQRRLADLGVTELTLYRGTGSDHRGKDLAVDTNPGSSWSTSPDVADLFARSEADKRTWNIYMGTEPPTGTRWTMTVPAKRVLSIPGHGLGCYEEHEVVVLRGDGDRAMAFEPLGS